MQSVQRTRPSGVSGLSSTPIFDEDIILHDAAPVLKDVSVKYENQLFNGSFMRENIFRRPGSPEVDKAWEDLGVDCKKNNVNHVQRSI